MASIELLDFYTPNCGACKMLESVLTQIELPEGVQLRKIDAEQFPDVAGDYHVLGVPTLILVKDGEVLKRHQGFLPASNIQTWFEEME